MLKETFFNPHSKNAWGINPNPYMLNAEPIFVMRSADHILSPSWSLINDYKDKKINWNEFKIRYIGEMNNENCKREMKRIKELSETKDVYIVCTCSNDKKQCHRYVLLELINSI